MIDINKILFSHWSDIKTSETFQYKDYINKVEETKTKEFLLQVAEFNSILYLTPDQICKYYKYLKAWYIENIDKYQIYPVDNNWINEETQMIIDNLSFDLATFLENAAYRYSKNKVVWNNFDSILEIITQLWLVSR